MRLPFATMIAGMLIVSATMVLAAEKLSAGAGMTTTLNTALDTQHSFVGQPFSLAVQAPYPNGASGLAGATIYGSVTKVTKAGRGTNPSLELHVEQIKFSDGTKSTLYAQVTKVTPKQTGRHGARILGGTAGGMLIGNWIGKSVFHGNAGGLVGATAGFLLSSNNKSDIAVPAGSTVGVQLTSGLSLK
jgi:hypothetical protein